MPFEKNLRKQGKYIKINNQTFIRKEITNK